MDSNPLHTVKGLLYTLTLTPEILCGPQLYILGLQWVVLSFIKLPREKKKSFQAQGLQQQLLG